MVTKIVYDDLFLRHEMSPGHPENPLRLKAALEGIKKINPKKVGVEFLKPKPAEMHQIYRIHEEKYIEDVRVKSEGGGGFFTLDTTSNEYTFLASIHAAGGGILAVEEIDRGYTNNAFILCRPPGHHAERNRAFGFCFMNNIAIAAKHLIEMTDNKRILIVDYDAHHGNGTQNSFYSSKEVLYIGLHQDGRTLFPGTGFVREIGKEEGQGFNVNIPMMPSAGDRVYETAFEEIVHPIAEAYKPDFILVSTGFDGHFKDPLAGLGLSTKGIAHLNKELMEIAETFAKGKIAFFLEGGYNLEVVKMASQNLVEELANVGVTKFADSVHESEKQMEYIRITIEKIREVLDGMFF